MREREREREETSSQQCFYARRDVNCSINYWYPQCCNLTKAHWLYGKDERPQKTNRPQKCSSSHRDV